ncbi:MAG: hypothetical protein ABSA30_09870 [Candidatus Aminicenantales bacterium]|jgi:hypothetical protein
MAEKLDAKIPLTAWPAVLAVVLLGPARLSAQGTPQARPMLPSPRESELGVQDKAEIAEVFRLQADAGDKIWPALAAADLPVILFNARYEFLVGAARPPAPWEVLKGQILQGKPCGRRSADHPQNFAVKVGSAYAGRAATLGLMNSKSPMRFGPDFHVVLILHEMFHAYQADQDTARFDKALAVYKAEKDYPFQDKDMAAAWVTEGAALARALKAPTIDEAARLAQEFLEIRDARRGAARLSLELVDYERELEWLEGLAEYAEIRFYELAASRADQTASIRFNPGLPLVLRWDFVRLEKQMGAQEGDLRFYLSGMAQARLLDRLSPEWKSRTVLGKVYLEDLVRSAASGGGPIAR